MKFDMMNMLTRIIENERLKRVVSRYFIPVVLTGYFMFFLLLIAAFGGHWKFAYLPDSQPIAFSHRIHVSKVNLSCDYCHQYAHKARKPGIPSVQKCMSCHENVATEKPEIRKLREYWDTLTPIPWARVHSLPEHVYFSHKRHFRKNIKCEECHGEVGIMDTVRQVRSLEMGWCIRCHRQNGAPDDCYTCHK